MTTLLRRGVVVILLVLVSGVARGQESVPADGKLRALALRATELEMRRQLASATSATIDSLLALYADSVVYEHPNAGAVMRGKDIMRRNMPQFMGSVRAVKSDPPRVTIGHGVAIVETRAFMEIDDRGKWVPVTRHGVRVVEFDSLGLIRRIIDYPW